jgi:Domain of unknown function (DUF3846)
VDTIEVFICEPGNRQYYKEIDNTLETMQELVGGYIERISIPYLSSKKIYLIADGEGALKGKEQSVWIDTTWVVGTCFFVKQRGAKFTSLGKSDKVAIEKYMSGESSTSAYHVLADYLQHQQKDISNR